MTRQFFKWVRLPLWIAGASLNAQPLSWFCDPGQMNRGSGGAEMDAGFRFELGVFRDGFQPTATNVVRWAQYWNPADSVDYKPGERRFNRLFEVGNNAAPFTAGAPAWIMGIRESSVGSERILFRGSTWNWPVVNSMNPVPVQWNTARADRIVLGEVNPAGDPHLMQSAGTRSYDQWAAVELPAEAESGAVEDPDQDGLPNLLEFVFGTLPTGHGPRPAVTVVVTGIDGRSYQEMHVPRVPDREAELVVEVSGDLYLWESGPGKTVVVTDSPEQLVVRDLTPLEDSGPTRFMRLRVFTPDP